MHCNLLTPDYCACSYHLYMYYLTTSVQMSSPRRRIEDSDDNGSETSSLCSERGAGGDMLLGKIGEDCVIIIRNMGSALWSDRKDGLLLLSQSLQRGRMMKLVMVVAAPVLYLFLVISYNIYMYV